jgi:cytidylate kinase
VAPSNYEPVVTVSATYGAGGSVIGPRLATELGLPFLDRLISADAAGAALASGGAGDADAGTAKSQEGLVKGEQEATPVGRFLSYFARAATVGAVIGPEPELEDDTDIRARTEKALSDLLGGAPGVVLGRAGAVVLRERPRAYHVRLDGPVKRRIEWAAPYEHLTREEATRRQAETDRTRTSFVKRLYRVDPADPSLYHLIIDPTVLGVEATVDVIKLAAGAFFG